MNNALTLTAPEGTPFVEMEREFDAPANAVFGAYVDPELVTQWLGPHGYEMTVTEYDAVSGGRYRYVHTDPDGEDYAFRGVFHTVRADELIVQTFEYEGFPDVVTIETMTFTDLGDGRSKITGHSVFPSIEARDGMVESGMETGMSEGFERLDALLG